LEYQQLLLVAGLKQKTTPGDSHLPAAIVDVNSSLKLEAQSKLHYAWVCQQTGVVAEIARVGD
jgi:hypothetical protein